MVIIPPRIVVSPFIATVAPKSIVNAKTEASKGQSDGFRI
jgi:hypothetical protein